GRVDRSGPFGWSGSEHDLGAHVARTIRRDLGGTGLPAAELGDLTAYLRALPPPPVPPASRGATLFSRTGRADRHREGGTDRRRHDVGSGGAFVTPSLVGLGRVRSYFHDGRYHALGELLDKTKGRMWSGESLSSDERAALIAYLEAL